MAGLARRRDSADRVQDALLDRLEELGRIQPDFDVVGWTKQLHAQTSVMHPQTATAHYKNAGLIGKDTYQADVNAFTESLPMTTLKDRKPDRSGSVVGKRILDEWYLAVDTARILHIMSKPWPCQLDNAGAFIPDDQEQVKRHFSFVYWTNVAKITATPQKKKMS